MDRVELINDIKHQIEDSGSSVVDASKWKQCHTLRCYTCNINLRLVFFYRNYNTAEYECMNCGDIYEYDYMTDEVTKVN